MLRNRFLIILIIVSSVFCQLSVGLTKESWPPKYQWASAAFEKSDASYSTLRARIVKEFNANPTPNLFYKKYESKVVGQDPKTYFAWGYSAFLTHAYGGSNRDGNEAIYSFLSKTDRMSLPDNYEFLRLRFLVAERYSYRPELLLPLAKRLLQKVPVDYEVQIANGRILQRLESKEEKHDALAYAQALAKQYPDQRGCYFLLGGAYREYARLTKDEVANQKAIQAYEKYLSLTPDTPRYAESRANAKTLIRIARRSL